MDRVCILGIFAVVLCYTGSEARKDIGRFRKDGFSHLNKMVRRHDIFNTEFRTRKNFEDDHNALMKMSKMQLTEGACSPPCTGKKVCVLQYMATESTCVHKRELREAKHLYRKFLKLGRMRRGHKHGKSRRGHRRGPKHMHLKKDLRKIGIERESEHSDMKSPLRRMKFHKTKTFKKSYGDSLLKQAEDMRELMTQGGYEPETRTEDKYPVCKNKIGDMKKRLNGWFVEQHQEVQHREHPHKGPHAHFPDFKRIGHCNCARSVMWNFHSMDKDGDHQLSQEEREHIENAFDGRETCVKPTIESCDKDSDSIITKTEWCCCFSNIESPCFEHIKLIEKGSDGKGYKPSCTSEGYYDKVQCHKSGFCWCSDLNGNPVAGSKVKGQPNCEEERRHLHRRQRGIQMTPLFQ